MVEQGLCKAQVNGSNPLSSTKQQYSIETVEPFAVEIQLYLGLTMETKQCTECGETFPKTKEYFYSNGFTPKGTQKWKPTCKPCEALRRKTRIAKILVEHYGELKCERCGFDKHFAALEFHHENPSEKEYQVSALFTSNRNKEVLLKELSKCIILCSNCHRIEHAGLNILDLI